MEGELISPLFFCPPKALYVRKLIKNMTRRKTTTLFNKNHISIIKIEDGLIFYPTRSFYKESNPKIKNWVQHLVIREGSYESSSQAITRKKREQEKPITERVKSPLGFYYTRTIHPQESVSSYPKVSETKTKHEWIFYNQDIRYILTYYTEYCGIKANPEIHPWNLIDKKAMGDNFITALLEEVTNIIESTKTKQEVELEQPQRNRYLGREEHHYTGNLREVKRLIFTDLFGYPEGPKYQTDNEKILSHGFDLKTSFRNM